jgi:hypothetical protein
MKIIRVAAVAALLAVLAVLMPASSADATQGATEVYNYETPCHHRERVARGIPAYSVHEGRGLMAYVRAHLNGSVPDAQLADFWAALDACDRDHPVARWAWSSMVLVSVERLG